MLSHLLELLIFPWVSPMYTWGIHINRLLCLLSLICLLLQRSQLRPQKDGWKAIFLPLQYLKGLLLLRLNRNILPKWFHFIYATQFFAGENLKQIPTVSFHLYILLCVSLTDTDFFFLTNQNTIIIANTINNSLMSSNTLPLF